MIFWFGTFSVRAAHTLNFCVNFRPQRGLITKIAPANIKMEESKGIWVLCLFPVVLEERATACRFNCAKCYEPSAVYSCSVRSSWTALGVLVGRPALLQPPCADRGRGCGGQARRHFTPQAFAAERNSLIFFNFIPAVKSIPNNNI